MSLRVAKAFENNIDDEQGWYASLLNRMAIKIEVKIRKLSMFNCGLEIQS